MAKKKTKKRHIAKKPTTTTVVAAEQTAARVATKRPAAHVTTPSRSAVLERSDYARQDVLRIGILAAGFIVLMGVAWAAFNYTGIGQQIYGLIRV